jgi:hypothetical protein
MKQVLHILLLFCSVSCTPYYKTSSGLYTNENPKNFEPEKGVPLAVNRYLDSIFKLNKYNPYSFGEVTTVKHPEIIKLDGMLELRAKLPSMASYYGDTLNQVILMADSRIEEQKNYLKENKILPGYKVNHIYKTYEDGFARLYEADFFTNFQYDITEVKYKLNMRLTREEEELFYHFFMRYPWIEFNDAEQTKSFNQKLFSIYDEELANDENDKEFVLRNVLQIQKQIRSSKDVDPLKLTKHLSKYWIATYSEEKNELYAEKFSELKSLSVVHDTTAITAGYGLFVEYSFRREGAIVKQAAYFEFDLNFLFRNVVIIEKDYIQFFE